MHQALYRKYRPTTFDDVCGQEHITSVLKYETMMGKTAHAYLFCGPRGTGKTTCARILAKAVNCENPVNGNPCGKCASCRSIDEDTAADVLEMDAASNTGVDYIRDIRDNVNYTPAMLKYKVYIIDEVHMLSQSAFNAFLKTLEEPPEHAIFILATTEQHKLLPTIISRCQRFDFHRINVSDITSRLMYISHAENIPLEESAATILAKQAMGGMRDAISLFELCSAGGHDVTAGRVTEILGLTGIEEAGKTALAVSRKNIQELFGIIRTVASSSKDISVFWQELEEFWRDMLIAQTIPDDAKLVEYLDLTEPERKAVRFTAAKFTKETLIYHFTVLDDAMRSMVRSPQMKRVTAELALIKMCDPMLDSSNAALNARISELEAKLASGNYRAAVSDEPAPVQSVPAEAQAEAVQQAAEPVHEEKSKAEDKGSQLIRVVDIGDAVERFGSTDRINKPRLANSNCYVSQDGSRCVIVVGTPMDVTMLSDKKTMAAMHSALQLSGLISPTTQLFVQVGEVIKKPDSMDELL